MLYNFPPSSPDEDVGFSPWSSWSPCTKTCSDALNPATKSRHRQCVEPPCSGSSNQERACNLPQCPGANSHKTSKTCSKICIQHSNTDTIKKSVCVSQMGVKIAWVPAVRTGTARGQSGGLGSRVHGPVGWVSSTGSAPLSSPGPTACGARTSWKETWSIASATSGPAEVGPCKSSQIIDLCVCWVVVVYVYVCS